VVIDYRELNRSTAPPPQNSSLQTVSIEKDSQMSATSASGSVVKEESSARQGASRDAAVTSPRPTPVEVAKCTTASAMTGSSKDWTEFLRSKSSATTTDR
jgi:hypothetical protein